jgi:DKNYY family
MKPLFCLLILVSCGVTPTDNSEKATEITEAPDISGNGAGVTTAYKIPEKTPIHEIPEQTQPFLGVHGDDCPCSVQFELADSQRLTHIKNGFYKSKTGHLYNKTTGAKELNGHLVDHDYFNGHFSQEVDPLTFRPLDGWYAVDKRFVYYYRPVSGGMQISKIDEADVKTFKILDGHYSHAQDKHHFYDNGDIIKNYNPQTTTCQRDERGRPISLSNKTGIYQLK